MHNVRTASLSPLVTGWLTLKRGRRRDVEKDAPVNLHTGQEACQTKQQHGSCVCLSGFVAEELTTLFPNGNGMVNTENNGTLVSIRRNIEGGVGVAWCGVGWSGVHEDGC